MASWSRPPLCPSPLSSRAGHIGLGATVAAAWVAVALALMPAYGPTWDCALGDYSFGERILSYLTGGGEVFLDGMSPSGLLHRAPHPDFTFGFVWEQVFPLATTLSALSCRLLWDGFGICPALYAHHLVNVVFVALLVGTIVVFTARRAGALAGVAAALLLLCSPCFFGHAFNNLKDVPEACLYALGVVAAYSALGRGGAWRWALAGACTALALAQKANALFIPVQMGLWLAVAWVVERARGRRLELPGILVGLAAGAAAFVVVYAAVSPQFWGDPLVRIGKHLDEILAAGNTAASGGRDTADSAAVSWHGPQHFLITTPPLLLALGLIGAVAGRMDGPLRALLVLWVLLPVMRTTLPGMRDFDGVRHFLEFYPALAMLGAFGLVEVLRWTTRLCERLGAGDRPRRAARAFAFTLLLLPGFLATLDTHPNGICYFNSFVGGLGGAQRAGLEDATDYWANSYWQGLEWLDRHAVHGAGVLVPVAPWVVSCAAPVRLRPDLRLIERDERPTAPLYVMYVTRTRPPYVRAVEDLPAAHEIRVQDGTILRIVAVTDAEALARVTVTFERVSRKAAEKASHLTWVLEDKQRYLSLWELVGTLEGLDREEAQARLTRELPEHLRAHAAEILALLDKAWEQLRSDLPGISRAEAGEVLWSQIARQR